MTGLRLRSKVSVQILASEIFFAVSANFSFGWFFKDLRLRNNLKRWPSVANRIKLNGNIYDDSWEVSELTILRFPLNFNTAQLKTRIWNSYLEYS